MSGQSPRSWNLPGSFNGLFASSGHSGSDPNAASHHKFGHAEQAET